MQTMTRANEHKRRIDELQRDLKQLREKSDLDLQGAREQLADTEQVLADAEQRAADAEQALAEEQVMDRQGVRV